MRNLYYSMYGAFKSGIQVHPQLDMKNLGISYKCSVPQSIADCWWFFDCENIPKNLPDYISDLKLSDETIKYWTK